MTNEQEYRQYVYRNVIIQIGEMLNLCSREFFILKYDLTLEEIKHIDQVFKLLVIENSSDYLLFKNEIQKGIKRFTSDEVFKVLLKSYQFHQPVAQEIFKKIETQDSIIWLKRCRQAMVSATSGGDRGGVPNTDNIRDTASNLAITRTETESVLQRRGTGEGYQAPVNLFAAYAATSPAPVTYSRVAKNSLPATGDASSMVALLAGTMAMSLGVLGLKKRRPW